MRAVQISRPNGPFEIVERDIPEPGPGFVRIKVQACGICHSDALVKEGTIPGIQYPRVPGHEIAGVVDAVGPGVAAWTAGQRVGVGWHGGNCGYCESCRRGEFFACRTMSLVTGLTHDGGYAEYMVTRAESVALVIGAPNALTVPPLLLIMGGRSIRGWYSGTSIDSQDTLAFSVHAGVRSMNEVFPLERAAEAYERMISGEARFRVVLTTGM